MTAKAKKRKKEEAKEPETPKQKESRWVENQWGVFGFIFGILGLIWFALPLGILAIVFGYLNLKKETANLWKLALPLGIFNTLFGLFALVRVL